MCEVEEGKRGGEIWVNGEKRRRGERERERQGERERGREGDRERDRARRNHRRMRRMGGK